MPNLDLYRGLLLTLALPLPVRVLLPPAFLLFDPGTEGLGVVKVFLKVAEDICGGDTLGFMDGYTM